MSESWLSKREWDLLYQALRPNHLTKDEFVDELIAGGGKCYKKEEMQRIIKNLREICAARGKFAAQYALDTRLQRFGGRGPGYFQGVLKEGLGIVIKKFITTPLDDIGLGANINSNNTNNSNGNSNLTANQGDNNETSNNHSNNNSNAGFTDENSNLSAGNNDAGANSSKSKSKKTAATVPKKLLLGRRRQRDAEDEDDDDAKNGDDENENATNSTVASESLSHHHHHHHLDPFPRLSRNSAKGATSASPQNSLLSDINNDSKTIPAMTELTHVSAAGTVKERVKKTRASTHNNEDAAEDRNNNSNDDQHQHDHQQHSHFGESTNTKPHQPTLQSTSELTVKPSSSSAIASSSTRTGGDDTAELNPFHSTFHLNQLLAAHPQLVKDTKTRLQQHHLPHTESKILEAICAGSHTNESAPDFSVQTAAYLPFRSPLIDIRHVLVRTNVRYGLSDPIVFKTSSLIFSKSSGDRIMLVPLKAAYFDKKGRSQISYDPNRWPAPPTETLRLQINDSRINSNFRRNWPKSRRCDTKDTPIRLTYLPLDVTAFVLQGSASQTLRYEMCTRELPMDLAVLVVRQIPVSLVVGNFMRRLVTDPSRLLQQRAQLRRLYCSLLGIKNSDTNNNNNNKLNSPRKNKNLLPVQQQEAAAAAAAAANNHDDDDDVPDLVEGDATMTLRCPIGYCTINIPVRGQHCDHLQCVDLNNYLTTCSGQCFWSCPICDKPMWIDEVIWDPLQHRLLKQCLTRNSRFDSGGTTFALKKKADESAVEEVIGNVAAQYQIYDPNNAAGDGKNAPAFASSMNGSGDHHRDDDDDYESYGANLISGNNKKTKVLEDLVDDSESDVSQPPTSTSKNSVNSVLSSKNHHQPPQPQQQQNAYLGLMGLTSHYQNTSVHQQLIQNRDKQIRRQESKFTRKTPHSLVAVKGNSKNDAIELD